MVGPHHATLPRIRPIDRLLADTCRFGQRPFVVRMNAMSREGGQPMAIAASPNLDIESLRRALTGQVFTPEDDGYDDAHRLFIPVYDGVRPAVIAQVADASDIATVLTTARETGVELAIRSGGHSAAGHSTTDGGIVDRYEGPQVARDRRRRQDRMGRLRSHRRRIQQRDQRRRASHRARRHGIGGAGRNHSRRRNRLPGPKARHDHRLATCRRGGHGERRGGAHGRGVSSRPLLGHQGRWRQFRGRHQIQASTTAAGQDRRRDDGSPGHGRTPLSGSSPRRSRLPKSCRPSPTS